MATLGTQYSTLLDVAKRTDPDGSPAVIAEVLNQSNEAIQDMPWVEGNLPTGMRGTIRTGIPAGIWRKLYGGVPPSKTTTTQVDDTCGMLENRSEPDKDLVEMYSDQAAFRMSEATGIMEGMSQTFAQTLFYGNTDVNPERFMGLSPRYSNRAAANGDNIISAQAAAAGSPPAVTTGLTSVWLISWAPTTITGIYPKNSQAGLIHEPLGLIDAFEANSTGALTTSRYRAYGDRFQWKCGLHVKDWRHAVRICNIDTAVLATQTGTQLISTFTITELIVTMIKALERLPNSTGKPFFYMNRTVKEHLKLHAMSRQQSVLSINDAIAGFDLRFLGVPVRRVDQLINAEAGVQ
jgi:hypothetical protein